MSPVCSAAGRSAFTAVLSLAAWVVLTFGGLGLDPAQAGTLQDRWTVEEKAVLQSMSLSRLPPAPADPSNEYEAHPQAVALGRQLFFDPRLSKNGQVACATCHLPERHFQDGRAVGQGIGTGSRRTMPVVAAAWSPWLFWDGRKDSLWSQALGPLEDAAEHGANRVQLVRLLQARYRADYESVFGPLPAPDTLPADAGPLGSAEEQRAWAALTPGQREGVNRAFANLGKAIAAYERTLRPGEARFDRYVKAVATGDAALLPALTAQEVRGLRLFIGKGQCATCHNGPLLTDFQFHNTGVPPRDAPRPDRGRAAAVARVQADEFNCAGRYSDAPADGCAELRFIATDDPALEGAFRTPGLRNVALRAPYMHAGQFASLEQVVGHYVRSPTAALGRSELAYRGPGAAARAPIRLSDAEAKDLVAFLRSLSEEAPPPDSQPQPVRSRGRMRSAFSRSMARRSAPLKIFASPCVCSAAER